jgi:hypothetical protein
MPKLTINLTDEQFRALESHAETKKRSAEEDLKAEWWGRRKALINFAEKKATKGATFRVYLPSALDDEKTRTQVYMDLGVKPREPKESKPRTKKPKPNATKPNAPSPKVQELRILPDDDAATACMKAEKIEESGSELSEAEILKKFGRDTKGRKI